jgi:hypothetical protein
VESWLVDEATILRAKKSEGTTGENRTVFVDQESHQLIGILALACGAGA